jgi:hypothetical protein
MRKIIEKGNSKWILLFFFIVSITVMRGQPDEYGQNSDECYVTDAMKAGPFVGGVNAYGVKREFIGNEVVTPVEFGLNNRYLAEIILIPQYNYSCTKKDKFDPYKNPSGAYGLLDPGTGGGGSSSGPVVQTIDRLGKKPLTETEFVRCKERDWNHYGSTSKQNQQLKSSDGKVHTGQLYKFTGNSSLGSIKNYNFYYFTPNVTDNQYKVGFYYFIPDWQGNQATTNTGGTTTMDKIGINYTYDSTGFPIGRGYMPDEVGKYLGIEFIRNTNPSTFIKFPTSIDDTFNQKTVINLNFNLYSGSGNGFEIRYRQSNLTRDYKEIYQQLMSTYLSSDKFEQIHALYWSEVLKLTSRSYYEDRDRSYNLRKELEYVAAGNSEVFSDSTQKFLDWFASAISIQIGTVDNDFKIIKYPEFDGNFGEDDDFAKVDKTDPFFINKKDDPWRLKKYLSPDDNYIIGLVAGAGDGLIETADLVYTITKFGVKNSPGVLLVRLLTDTENTVKEKIEEIKVVKDLVAVVYDKQRQQLIFNSIVAATQSWFKATVFQNTNVEAGYNQGKILFEIIGSLVGVTELKTLLQTGKFSATALTKIGKTADLFKNGFKINSDRFAIASVTDEAGVLVTKGNKAVETFVNVKYMQKGTRPDPKTYIEATHISNHLSKFDGGVTKFISYNPSGTIGPQGGTFVLPKSQADNLIAQAGGDVNKLTDLLGLNRGDLGTSPYRINIDNPLGLRMPDGNEAGANINWIPGGKTSGGIFEATIDQIQPGTYNKHLVF